MEQIMKSIASGLLFAMCLGMTACSGGGGGSAAVSGSPGGIAPDFTIKAYTLLVMGQAVMNQSVTVHMICNDNAASGMRDEVSNLSLANNQVGGAGCNNVYNGAFEVTNNDVTYQLYFEVQIDGVTVDSGYVPAGQVYTYQNGYVIP